ncbi:nuclear transport factor 2 family protein [Neorhizobium galegae]|uniref:Nuclear transport factor 2 family protein n=1 Tax=Neorhizobium galegae TaxID=399 RepID=A0A6A1TMC3_NEOGA|nr:nuclear transport factor 2 family protein [Neorhizobium galegae]KAB1085360.1 nuclear transport factor 2 family protein [Neorhizobium galegae]
MSDAQANDPNFGAVLMANAVRVFGEPDGAKRLQALKELWSPDGALYEDEHVIKGIEAISATVGALLDNLPAGTRFAADGPVVGHHGLARLRWITVDASGTPGPVSGTDVAFIENGRITSLYVFLDPMG